MINNPLFTSIATQQITEPGFYLFLNCVNHKAEQILAFGPFESAADARAYHQQELLEETESVGEGYDRRTLSFRNGPLRMMNPLDSEELNECVGNFGHGIVLAHHVQTIGFTIAGCYGQ